MLKKLTETVIKLRWVVIAFWILAAAVVFFAAPNLTDVAKNDQASFLPSDADAVKADKLIRELFPDKGGRSSIVIVIKREEGIGPGDRAFAEKLEDYINSNKEALNVRQVISPFADKELEKYMVSSDKKVATMNINLTAPPYSDKVNRTVEKVRMLLDEGRPQGLNAYLTGDAVISVEEHETTNKSMDLTVKVTILLVLAILVFIYRSPIAAILPLFTVGLSFVISRGIVALLAQSGMKISTFTETFLIAVLFGAGTDYCLLIISRFKEELISGKSILEALKTAMPNTGIAIISSGGTVVVGFLFMIFAKFGLFNSTGPSVAIGVIVSILAVITLIPALLAVLGEKILWPLKNLHKHKEKHAGSFWGSISEIVTSRPGRFAIISILVFVPVMLLAFRISISYDQIKDLPGSSGSVAGYELMKENFSNGEMLPVKVVLKTDKNIWDTGSLRMVDKIADSLDKLDNVEKVRTATRPLGERITQASLPKQIEQLVKGLDEAGGGMVPLQSGIAELQDGVEKIASGISTVASEFNSLSVSSDKFAQGTGLSDKGLLTLSGGAESLRNGIMQTEEGMAKVKTVINDITTALERVMQKNKEISSDIDFMTAYYSLKAIPENISNMQTGLEAVKTGLSSSSAGYLEISANLKQMQGGLEAMAKGQAAAAEDLRKASGGLSDISKGLGKSSDAIGKMQSGIQEMHGYASKYASDQGIPDDVFYLPSEVLDENPEFKEAMAEYVSENGKGVVFDVILSIPPYTNKALDSIKSIEDTIAFTLKGTGFENSEFLVGGSTAALSEIRQLVARDFTIVMIFVLSGIFIVLALVLRSLIAPFYLIATTLLSFATTMGITYFVFEVILGYDGIHWAVPFFSFCVLVALGVDYNIFLMSRIKEEYSPGDTAGSVSRGLTATGVIITSCGIIMAGTFAAMLISPLRPIVQVGFAAVTGLLLDTFIIRCLTVPAIAVLLGELNWWPGRKVMVVPYNKSTG